MLFLSINKDPVVASQVTVHAILTCFPSTNPWCWIKCFPGKFGLTAHSPHHLLHIHHTSQANSQVKNRCSSVSSAFSHIGHNCRLPLSGIFLAPRFLLVGRRRCNSFHERPNTFRGTRAFHITLKLFRAATLESDVSNS